MSAGMPIETPRAAPAILLTSPDKTFPAPHSTNTEIPFSAMKAMLSRHRTVPGNLGNEKLADLCGFGHGRRQHIRDQRNARLFDGSLT